MYGGYNQYDTDRNGFVNVYADGACPFNGMSNAKAGIGVWFKDNSPLNVSAPVKGRQTSIEAEIQAATRAILQARNAGISNLRVNTDSRFVVDSMTNWIHEWKQNGWRTSSGQPVQNRDSLMQLDNAANTLHVVWNHVPGHSGVYGNVKADALASQAAQR